MFRRTVHRGIAALACVTILAVAAPRPAAAADPGFLDRLAGLWSTVAVEGPTGLWHTLTHWFGSVAKANNSSDSADAREQGWGIDPNGNSLTAPQGDPTASSLSGSTDGRP